MKQNITFMPLTIRCADGQQIVLQEGPVTEPNLSIVLDELAARWRSLSGSHATAMKPDKVFRAEGLRVERHMLLFDIARHAGTMNGSTRKAMHTWSVDLNCNHAEIIRESYRQVEATARPYRKEDARKDAMAVKRILCGRRKNRGELVMLPCGEITFKSSVFISRPGRFNQTRMGRTKRFVDELQAIIGPIGWKITKGGYFSEKIVIRKPSP